MLTLLVIVAVLGILFGAAALATYEGEVLNDAQPDDHGAELPATALQPEDVAEVRFDMALRGYRMAQVDEVLARLAAELAARDSRIVQLEQALVDVVEPAVTQAEAEVAARAEPAPEPTVEEPEAFAPLDTGASTPAVVAGPLTATTWWEAPTPELATDDPAELPEPAPAEAFSETPSAPERTDVPETPEPAPAEAVADAPADLPEPAAAEAFSETPSAPERTDLPETPEPAPAEAVADAPADLPEPARTESLPEPPSAPEPTGLPEPEQEAVPLPPAADAFSFPELQPPDAAPEETEEPKQDDWWSSLREPPSGGPDQRP